MLVDSSTASKMWITSPWRIILPSDVDASADMISSNIFLHSTARFEAVVYSPAKFSSRVIVIDSKASIDSLGTAENCKANALTSLPEFTTIFLSVEMRSEVRSAWYILTAAGRTFKVREICAAPEITAATSVQTFIAIASSN
eukprot:TRINITY_DN7477_c0_g3_i1.p1 TRINITY_DN7477_c0_g3~~TRINITY_DN7477_c0_g3_i1.p1  ORF type:complete len:142 (+),score=16.47 TRINITY_DN7477_c0_g3_i1:547-972(+)